MNKRAFVLVNTAVMLFGFAGLFSRWIDMPALGITFGRVLFSSLSLGLYMLASGRSFRVESGKDLAIMLVSGALLAAHWWSILKAIQVSTVAVGTIAFSTFPFFVTFLEPLFFRQRLKARNLVIALVTVAGVFITIPEFSLENSIFRGVAVGMVSPLAYSLITVLNKDLAPKYSGTLISFCQQAAASIVLLPAVLTAGIRFGLKDIALLAVFGSVATALAHTLFINSLKDIPARLAGVCASMETVYGIVFAMIFLGEIPSLREALGAAVIFAAVVYAQLTEEKQA